MARLQMRIKTDPQPRELNYAQCRNLSRVYFSAHPEGYEKYRDLVAKEIYRTHDCAFCFDARPDLPYDEDMLADLQTMNLFVIPITTKLLTDPAQCRVLEVDLAIAEEYHIPVLPLMQENGLESLYRSVEQLKNRQFLNQYAQDLTALAYEDKLKSFLDSVLLSQSQIQAIRDAFVARIFLSYRKKDRKLAQSLMRAIHKAPALRDVAIWYDEFLTPGEDFNENIRQVLQQSQLFTLAVTPNLLEEGNYVIQHEYPAALELDKLVLPVQLQATEPADAFVTVFLKAAEPTKQQKIQQLVQPMVEPGEALCHSVQQILEERLKISTTENTDAMHQYRMGMAYLQGLDVEQDRDIAIPLLISAAKQGNVYAMAQLAELYAFGHYVEQSNQEAENWTREMVTWLEAHCNQSDWESRKLLLSAKLALADKLFRTQEEERLMEAKNFLCSIIDAADPTQDPAFFAKAHHNLGVVLGYLASPCPQQILMHMKESIRLEKLAAQGNVDPEAEKKQLLHRLISSVGVCKQIGQPESEQAFLNEALMLYGDDWAEISDREILGDLATLAWWQAQDKGPGRGDADLRRAQTMLEQIPADEKRARDWDLQSGVLLLTAECKYWSLERGKLKEKVKNRLKKEIKTDLQQAYQAAQQYMQVDNSSLNAREALCDTLSQSVTLHRLLGNTLQMQTLEQELLELAEELKDVTGNVETMMTLSRMYAALGKTRGAAIQRQPKGSLQKDVLLEEALQYFRLAEDLLERRAQRGGQYEVMSWAGIAYSKASVYRDAGRYAEALTAYRACETLLQERAAEQTPATRTLLADCQRDAAAVLRKQRASDC